MKNNNPYLAGVCDCWYSGCQTDLWAEYKYIPITKPKAPVVPALSRQQLQWIKNRLEEGRNIWVVVGYKKGVVVYPTLKNMEQGFTPEEFLERTISRKEFGEDVTAFCGPSAAIQRSLHGTEKC